jgi:hypothetical protein
MTLTAAVDAQTTVNSFLVKINDPCSRAVFVTNPHPFADITVIMPGSNIQTAVVKVYTDVEVSYNAIICPITASLSSTAVFADITGDYATITIDKS